MTQEALKRALEALEADELDMVDDGSGNMVFRKEQAIAAIKKALSEPEQTNTRPYYTIDELNAWADEKEKQSWRNAAIRIGEELSSFGPDGYYDMNAWQWLDWAMENVKKAQPEQEPKFFTHNVEQPHDWSEWVCPDPKGYLMKCCDCGLVHEAEFGVVRYKSETEREDCDRVDDPNLQAVFRMRRSEQWSPEDTAHRAGGLPMEQPAQPEKEPVAWGVFEGNLHDMFFTEAEAVEMAQLKGNHAEVKPLYAYPPQPKKQETVAKKHEPTIDLGKYAGTYGGYIKE